jgi:PAS domain S-box-containing protein
MSSLQRSEQSGGDDIAALLVDSVRDYAIFMLDPRGFVRTWNRGARRLKGYETDEIVGKHISTFYVPSDREAGLPDALLVRAETEGSVEHQGWRVRKDGTRFWANVTLTALRRPDGTLAGFAKVTRDLTEAHEHEETLRRALAREREAALELARLNELRTRFLAAVAHDLTTPITVIQAAADLLGDDPGLTDHDLLERVQRNADDLAVLAQQLREFSELDAGPAKINPEPIDLHDLVEDLLTDLASLHGDVRLDNEVRVGMTVPADPVAIRRVLTNLLTNALSFSPPQGTVCVAANADEDAVIVAVSDEGPGIPADELEHIFDEFWQGRNVDRHSQRGLGLGLSIVKQYVEAHGGRIWVETELGAGSTFRFSLPGA